MTFKSNFQKVMWIGSGISLLGWIGFLVLDNFLKINLSPLWLTFMTAFYHLAVRLVFGEWLLMKINYEKIDYNKKYFAQTKFERAIYKKLKLKRVISHAPTYSPEEFSLENNSWSELIVSTIRSEIVHTVNVFLSFIPLLFTIKHGALLVFLITSLFAALFDLYFVMIQRCNRPRLIRLAEREKNQV